MQADTGLSGLSGMIQSLEPIDYTDASGVGYTDASGNFYTSS